MRNNVYMLKFTFVTSLLFLYTVLYRLLQNNSKVWHCLIPRGYCSCQKNVCKANSEIILRFTLSSLSAQFKPHMNDGRGK